MQGNRFFYEQGKLLLDGGGEGRFELRALGNNAYRLMEAPRRFVFTFFTRRDGSLAVRVDVEGSPVQRNSSGRGHKAERCRAACTGGKVFQSGVGRDVDVRSTRWGTRARTSPLEALATVTSVRKYLSGRRLRAGISTRLAHSHVGAGDHDRTRAAASIHTRSVREALTPPTNSRIPNCHSECTRNYELSGETSSCHRHSISVMRSVPPRGSGWVRSDVLRILVSKS